MGLIDRGALKPLLACPRCRAPLAADTQAYRCMAPACLYSSEGFPLLNEVPVLVDFEDSILVKQDLLDPKKGEVIKRARIAGFIRRVLNALLPSNAVAAKNAERVRALLTLRGLHPRLLIVGGGSAGAGTRVLYEDEALDILAFDIYGSSMVQFIGDAHRIPLADQTVGAVWIQAVLEHVLNPAQVVDEIHRVLRADGLVYAETPFMQQVHEGPYDFTRFTDSGHRWLFRKFEMIDSGAVMGSGTQLIWSIEHLVRGVFRSVRAGVLAKLLFFWLRYFDHVIPKSYAIDGASAVYFLGRRSDRTISPRDMPALYQGAPARRLETAILVVATVPPQMRAETCAV